MKNEKPVVYLNEPLHPDVVARLAEKCELVSSYDHPERLDAVIVRQQYCRRDVIANAPRLKIISVHGTGTDRIDCDAAVENGVPVVIHKGYNSRSVAELAVALLLAADRKLKEINRGLLGGKYACFGEASSGEREIFGKTVGIYGTGAVGQEIARIMRYGFGSEILGYNPHRSAEELRALGFEAVPDLVTLFERSDFIFVCPRLNDETLGSIDSEVLSHARPDLIISNVGRGGIINEDDLYEALKSGTVRAAGSDVFAHEPPERDNPLLGLDNFIATFHVGGSTVEAMERLGHAVVDDIFKALGLEP